MSATIDERVVEMRFDNKQFKQGASETMSVLDKLKAALNLPGATKGFESIDKAAKDVKLDGIQAGIEALTKRFSTMGIVADQVIRNITNSITGTLSKAVNFVKEGIVSGGIRRSMNIENAHFQLQALLKDEEKVQEIMDNAMTSVDGTAFAYDEAAKAASMFAASGIQGGEEMVNALMGVVGVAAMTNSEYEGISNIFTTVAGQGRIMADQLNQFASRGLNAAATIADYFNEVNAGGGKATDSVRKAIATLSQGTKTTEADIREMVSDGAISFEIFAQAMNDAFGDSAKKANETFTGSFANMKSALARIGAEFVSPLVAQNSEVVKMFNAMKDRINDVKAALTFNEELGNVNALSKQFSDAVLRISKSITKYLLNLDLTKPMELFYYGVEIVKNSVKGLRTVLAPLAVAFKNVFMAFSIDDVIRIASGLEDITSKMKLSYKASSNLYDAFKGVFNVGKLLIDIFVDLLKALIPINKPAGELGDGLLSIAGGLGRSLTKFTEWVRSSGKVEKAMSSISYAVKTVSEWITTLVKNIVQFVKDSKDIPEVQKVFENFGTAVQWIKESLLGFFSEIGDNLSGFGELVVDSLPIDATGPYEFFTGLIKDLADGINKLFEIARGNEGFDAFVTNFQEFIKSIKDNIGDGDVETRFETIKSIIKSFTDFLKEYVAPALSSIDLGSIISLIGGIASVASVSKLTKSFSSMGTVVKGIGKSFSSTLGSVRKTLEAYQNNLKADTLKKIATALLLLAGALTILSFCDSERLTSAAVALSMVGGVLVVAMDKFKSARDGVDAMQTLATGLSSGIKQLTSGVKWKMIGSAIKDVAKSIGIIALSIVGIGLMYKNDKEALQAGADMIFEITKAMVAIMASMAGLSALLGKDGAKGMKDAGTSMLALSASLMVIVLALKSLFKMELPDDWSLKVEILAGIFGGIVTLLIALGAASALASGQKISSGPILTAAIAMILVTQALKSLFKMELPDDWLVKVGILAGIFAALSGLILAIGAASSLAGGKLKATGTILAMCAFVGTAVVALMVLSNFPADKMVKGATALGVILLALGASLAGAGKISSKDSYKSVLAMAVTAGVITISLSSLSMIESDKLKKACVALGAMLLALAVDFAAIGSINNDNAYKAVAAMVAETLAITLSLVILSNQDWQGLLAAAASLSSVLLAMSGAFAIIGMSKASTSDVGNFLLATVSLLPIAAALYTLSTQPWQGMLAAGTALSEVIVSFSAAFTLITLARPDTKSIALFLAATLALVPIGAALYVLSDQNWVGLLSAATAITEVLGGMSLALLAATAVGKLGVQSAIDGIIALDLFIADLAVVLTALGALSKIPGFTDIIQNGGEVLTSIGDALGNFVGGIIGGVLGGISSSFVEIGKNLTKFSEEAQPFFDSMSSMDPAVFTGIAALAEAMLLLTAKSLLDGISGLFGSKYTLSDLGAELRDFADPLVEYADKVKGIDANAVEGSANAIKILADAANSLGRTGGKLQEIIGEKRSLADFGEELAAVGPKLRDYALATKGVDAESVEGSANAIKVLADAANTLGRSGGYWQDIVGEQKSLTEFAGELLAFAPSIVVYAALVKGLDNTVIDKSAIAMTTLIEASNMLENQGGVAGFFGGEKDLASFGEKLVSFGTSLADYYDSVSGIEAYKLTGVTTAVQKLTSVASDMKGIDFGSLGSFATNLKKMANAGIEEFISAFQNAVDNVSTAVGDLIDAALGVFTGRASEFKTKGNAIMTQFTIGISGEKNNLTSTTESMVGAAITTMQGKSSDVRKEGQSFTTVYADGIKSKKKDLTGTAGELLTDTLGTIAQKKDDFKSQGKSTMNAFVDGVRGAKSGFNDIESDMKDVGNNLVAGLKTGIENKMPSLISTVSSLAYQIDSTTREVLQINSPSKLAIETAEFYSSGIIIGLGRSKGAVTDAAADLAYAMNDGFQGALNAIFLKTPVSSLTSGPMTEGMVKLAESIKDDVQFTFDILGSSDVVDRVNLIVSNYERISAKNANTAEMANRAANEQIEAAEKAEDTANAALDAVEKAQDDVDKKQQALDKANETLASKKEALDEKEAALKTASAKKTSSSLATAQKNAEKAKKDYEAAQKEVEQAEKDLAASQTELTKQQAEYQEVYDLAQMERAAADDALLREQERQNRQYRDATYENGEIKSDILVQEDLYWKNLLAIKQQGNESAKYLDMTLLDFEEEVLQKTLSYLQQYTSELESTRDSLMNSMSLFSEANIGEGIGKEAMINNLEGQIDAIREYDVMMQVLEKRMGGTKLWEYVQTLGVDSLPYLRDMVDMTDEELTLYTTLYDEKFKAANEYAKNHLKELKTDVQNELADLFSVDEGLIDIDEFTKVFDGTMASISKYLTQASGDAGYSMKEFTVTTGFAIVEGVKEVAPQVEEAGEELGEGFMGGVKNPLKDNKVLANAVDKFLKQVDGKQRQAFSSGEQIGNQTVAGMNAKQSAMVNAGAMAGQGLVNGIYSKLSAAEGAGAAIASAALSKAMQVLAIHSPSRKMKEVGAYAGMGFVNGLLAFVTEAGKVGEQIGTSAMDGLRDEFGSKSTYVDPDLQPTIKPVVDLTNVRNSISDINRIFNDAIQVSAGHAQNALVTATNVKEEKGNSASKKNGDTGNKGETHVEFVQNNYSPKALSRIEIYRDTKNLVKQYEQAVKS